VPGVRKLNDCEHYDGYGCENNRDHDQAAERGRALPEVVENEISPNHQQALGGLRHVSSSR
jgi:hypothetical protein